LLVLPGIIEEVDSVFERLGDHVVNRVLTEGGTEMKATHAQDGDLKASPTHRTFRDLETG
jgi:hypothetical protein